MDAVKFGLVGYGFGGRYFHAPLLSAAPECELIGVVTRSQERRAQLADQLPGTRCFDTLGELAAAGAEAVGISTPAGTHTSLTEEAIGWGLSVVCDKPFALDADAARRTVDLAAAGGVVLSPYQNRRWDSDFLSVRAAVDAGTLGEVRRFESRFERFAPDDGPGASGGGTILDFGSHLVDQSLVLLGPVTSVYAELSLRGSGLDDDVFIALQHATGARSHLWGSWSQHAPGPRFRVTGTSGSMVVTTTDTQEDVLIAGGTPDGRGPWGSEAASDLDRIVTGSGTSTIRLERGAWDTFYPAFARAVRGLGPAPVPAPDAVATAVVLDAARRSADTGTVVAVAHPPDPRL
ncbi:Gfo/Idh/MocA family protein [Nocardioides cynanchi]|uniref:Gfo/Idh/MocA family protein n=1 Tax=Nocardioides cynanchi TaxID=2558918 RepID=UPI00124524A9|nr:Gfo/Idh/MocA family oxidoreductase [Nocardioides cynanchi]